MTAIAPGDDIWTTGMTVWHRILTIETVHNENGIERQTLVVAPLTRRGTPAAGVSRRIEARAVVANLRPDGHRPRRRTFTETTA